MSTERDPATDQPLPVSTGGTAVHQLVMDSLDAWGVKDEAERDEIARGLAARRELGVSKYGRALESHNGRDALQDCWEEVLDATVYAVQAELETQNSPYFGDVILVLVQILRRLASNRLGTEPPDLLQPRDRGHGGRTND